jgi:hypothetical protein
MKISFIQPRPELRSHIHAFWIFESPVGMPASESSLAAPNGSPKLIIPYENSITSIADGREQESVEEGLYFVGNRDSSTLLHTSSRKTGFIGIEFSPCGAYPIFGIPMDESANRLLSADVIFAKWGREMRERLRNVESVNAKVDFIQDQMAKLAQATRLRNPVVEFCVNTLKRTDGLIWQRLRMGDRQPFFAAILIGVLYVGIGTFGLVYRHGDPFMAFFVVLGSALLISGYIVAPPTNANAS